MSTPIGHGAGQYEAVGAAMLTWQMHVAAQSTTAQSGVGA